MKPTKSIRRGIYGIITIINSTHGLLSTSRNMISFLRSEEFISARISPSPDYLTSRKGYR